MENASKALIFAASTLIAIMLLSFMVYMFRRFGETARSTEKRYSTQEIDAFNSKFIHYETGGEHSLDDSISVTYARTASSPLKTESITYAKLFKDNAIQSQSYYSKALIGASQILNKGYDVVTAINDAIDVNYNINNAYRYDYLELQNSVEIIVDLGDYKNDFSFSKGYKYLVIEPNKNVKPKCVYGSNSIVDDSENNETNKKANANLDIFKESNEISVYDILDSLRDTKVVEVDNKTYTVYKYYFIGETIVNEYTGLIETVKFNLVKDKNF